ncbi:MAG: hypothetical protein FWC95_05830 [Defluviitaleaceae bacterium]|nr:hypothetical protein [Defluviitaleaceae bacterium]
MINENLDKMNSNALIKRMVMVSIITALFLVVAGSVVYNVFGVQPVRVPSFGIIENLTADDTNISFFARAMPFIVGVIIGAGVSVVKILMLAAAVNRFASAASAGDAEASKAAAVRLRLSGGARFLVTACVLVAAGFLSVRTGFVDIIGVVFGVLVYPVALYSSKKAAGGSR